MLLAAVVIYEIRILIKLADLLRAESLPVRSGGPNLIQPRELALGKKSHQFLRRNC
jgi:hypothetical protein